jgi:hypothetical protein
LAVRTLPVYLYHGREKGISRNNIILSKNLSIDDIRGGGGGSNRGNATGRDGVGDIAAGAGRAGSGSDDSGGDDGSTGLCPLVCASISAAWPPISPRG